MHKEDVQVLKLYKTLNFNQPMDEYAKGYRDITYSNEGIMKERKLDVILIPHSHCDAGWLETYEEYSYQTNRILKNANTYLPKFDKMKFIYAEMGFFEIFWNSITEEDRQKTRDLLKSDKYEIVTGGWVQNDEANSFFYGILMQLIEGHEFLQNQMDYKPKNHWSIDPFGLSTTMAYIMKKSGFDNAAINRIHYLLKQKFAQDKLFEFNWRQLIGGKESQDLFTHVLPYEGYLFYAHCGPDSKVCCNFDFLRLHVYSCPSEGPVATTNDNVKERSALIADQFRKRGQLMNNSATFVPLGYDFAWSFTTEWEDQYTNFQKIFDHINNDPQYNMNIRFGTLDDYFTTVHKNMKETNKKPETLSGDFFTYSDETTRYWSGYYVSRPYHKRFERILEHYLRAADIIYSSVLLKNGPVPSVDYNLLVNSRRILGIFQHHDGITGTSRQRVMDDYRSKLFNAVVNCYTVIEESVKHSLNIKEDVKMIDKIENSASFESTKTINENKNIIIMNPLAHEVDKISCLKVNSTDYYVMDEDRKLPDQEYYPVFTVLPSQSNIFISETEFELCFESNLPPLGMKSFILEKGNMYTPPKASVFVSDSKIKSSVFKILPTTKKTNIKTQQVKVTFDSKTGFIRFINITPVDLHFAEFGLSKVGTHSGAYLFNPDGPSKRLKEDNNVFVVSEGKLKGSVYVRGNIQTNLVHYYEINKYEKTVSIQNTLDISSIENFEMGMKLNTGIDNKKIFYTDLNGFQLIKRRFLDSLPLQGNFYPFPSMMYIEDSRKRLTILTGQPLGVSSTGNGVIEILIDRRSSHDDEAGMGEGVIDKMKARSNFKILLESFETKNSDEDALAGFGTIVAHNSLNSLLYPPIKMITTEKVSVENINNFSILKKSLPCDIHLVMSRSMLKKDDYNVRNDKNEVIRGPSDEIGLIFNRVINNCGIKSSGECSSDGSLIFANLFNFNYKSIHNSSLTLLHVEDQNISDIKIDQQELRTIKIVR
uniref:Alpha-mannosidase n=1 Tax=Parastrongyloides trichosuri TaxID=131310 RepID=A0A0N4Z6W4_PARTI